MQQDKLEFIMKIGININDSDPFKLHTCIFAKYLASGPLPKPIAVYCPVCHGGIYIHKCKLYYISLLKLTYTNHLSAQ